MQLAVIKEPPANATTLTKEMLEATSQLIGRLYLADARPWVIGYSGGKDSTATLQLVWHSLAKLPRAQLTKTVYVIASDTLVETPVIVNHLNKTLSDVSAAAKAQGLPFETRRVTPKIDDTFWVNLIGRGYPAPYNKFRWCTDRMKIEPATRFITEQITAHGEVVLVLGARKSESATRAQVMSARRRVDEHLSRHCDIPSAWVFTPLEDWLTEDVWVYLLNTPAPWGGHNRELVTMYRNAQAGECPLVVDKHTPSCGNSRFGCWTCTVVKQDRSMEAMVDGGQAWLEPLLAFRNFLAGTHDPAVKRKVRDHRRRSGRVEFWGKDGERKLIWGPYKLAFRRELLRRLLEAQQLVRQLGPDPKESLISRDELDKIRQLWRFEEGDWNDTLPGIYADVTGETLEWPAEDWSGMGGAELEVLSAVAQEHDLPGGLLVELFEAERKQHGMNRRSRIFDNLDAVLRKDWRSEAEALAAASAGVDEDDDAE